MIKQKISKDIEKSCLKRLTFLEILNKIPLFSYYALYMNIWVLI
jgi:hypothetical protein